MKLVQQGNQSSVKANAATVAETMNKKDQNSHLLSHPEIYCHLSAYVHHILQGINLKKQTSDSGMGLQS